MILLQTCEGFTIGDHLIGLGLEICDNMIVLSDGEIGFCQLDTCPIEFGENCRWGWG